ncbi:putative nuclease HARBI1 [Eriocheir sinensis]|uniref:putative nuclease HARBI1 n=1 Tax=Eriocheir sinensis TaxID=95602 RepID=UPI0021C716F7|nr:putative nuclease HARBI1 [Eriocheir sinensis]XP_050700337.1 putative nuclease HARBI1 [Eriocheir sinensis]XP_050700338.1 putative nuclease HARBI1 [Eriocheir sinensis]XP_050724655.1 putative nuclease HARBI1 [Eriocheir sinensis]
MAAYDDVWDEFDLWDQWEELEEMDAPRVVVRRPRRIVTDRMNPFTAMSDNEFVDRFRLRKNSMYDLIEEIREHLPAPTDSRGCPVPAHLQTLIALRCMMSGDHQMTLGDCHDVSQTTVSQCLKVVSRAVASLSRHHIMAPSGNDRQRTVQEFYAIHGMPGVIGAIDCTHIAIVRPSVANPEVFRCRKGYFSMNVQAVCGPDLLFHNVVARWPGSVHDSRILDNSRLCAQLEETLEPQYHLLGDAGYALKRYLLTPVAVPTNDHERAYNSSHTHTRNTVERAFGVLKKRFAYLGKKMRTSLDTTKAIIVAAVVLHNIAVKTRLVMPQDGAEHAIINVNALHNGVPVDRQGNAQGRLKRQQIIRDFF